MKTLNRFLWFFLLAFLLGISGSALGSDVGTATAASKDAVLTQQLQQDFSNHLDFRNVTVVVDDRVALLQGSVETYREKMDAERLARKHHGIEQCATSSRCNRLSQFPTRNYVKPLPIGFAMTALATGSHSTISK
jgi:hypothetical protein